MNNRSIPAAVEVHGVHYLHGQGGNLVPVANIRRQDLLRHEIVYEATDFALDLSAEIARFNGHSRADFGALDALLAEQYGVVRDPDFQGNRTYTSLDGKRQVKIAVGKHINFGASLHVAKKLLDEMILENAAGAGPVLMPLINQAFRVDKEGKVDSDMLRAIRRLEIEDPRWPKIVKAIDDAEEIRDTTTYLRFYQKGETGKMELIPLDIAVAHPTPEAFARRSLRRQVAELQEQLAALKAGAEPAEDSSAVFPELSLGTHLVNANELLGTAIGHLDQAVNRDGADTTRISAVITSLMANQMIISAMFNEARKARSDQSVEVPE